MLLKCILKKAGEQGEKKDTVYVPEIISKTLKRTD